MLFSTPTAVSGKSEKNNQATLKKTCWLVFIYYLVLLYGLKKCVWLSSKWTCEPQRPN